MAIKLLIICLGLAAACNSDKPSTGNTDSGAEVLQEHTSSHNARQSPVAEQEEPLPQDTLYHISGTEPFWSMLVAKPQIRFHSMDGDTLLFDYQEPRQAQARPADYVQVFELNGQQQLILRKTTDCPCSDGMSDKEYPYQATLILKNKVLEGCGRTP